VGYVCFDSGTPAGRVISCAVDTFMAPRFYSNTTASSIAAVILVQTAAVVTLFGISSAAQIGDARLWVLLAMTDVALVFVWDLMGSRRALVSAGPHEHEVNLALESGKAVGWDWDVKSGRDVWFGNLKTLFGLSADKYTGHVEDFRRRVHPDDRELVWRAVADARDNHKDYRATFRIAWPDGTIRRAAATGKFDYGADGEPVRMRGIAADVTELPRAEDRTAAAVLESEERFRLLADAAPVMIWTSGTDALCDYFNRRWLEFTGRAIEAELGNGWTDLVHPEDHSRSVEAYFRAFEKREPFKIDYRLRRHDGEYRWILDTGTPRFSQGDGSFVGYVGSAFDITQHKVAEQALSGLSHRLMDVNETERSWIAQELHDDVAQRMALVTIELDRLAQDLPAGAVEVRDRLRELGDRTIGLEKDVQVLTRRLQSAKLELLGIVVAAAALSRDLATQHGVDIDFSHDGIPAGVPRRVSLALYRILQEALGNALAHSQARQFWVTLRGRAGEIQLEVVDGGIGFDRDAALKHGVGLIGMRERIGRLNGEMIIESKPGCGTRIVARVGFVPAGAGPQEPAT
jgi:PAS domain S-box-containing protein